MKEMRGDLWDFWEQGRWVCVPTNGVLDSRGQAVMGAGVAKQAMLLFPALPKQLGERISGWGNHVFVFPCGVITFPTKHDWKDPADLELIQQSCRELSSLGLFLYGDIYLPRPGCGLGGLDYDSQVRPILLKNLGGRVVVITN